MAGFFLNGSAIPARDVGSVLDSAEMEDPDELLGRVLAFVDANEQISAVIQTGSRARGDRVDALSDLDIELIGPGAADLVGKDDWARTIGDVLVSVHLANDDSDEPDWPTHLVVFAGGRKIDFTLAGEERIERLKRDGLDGLYRRGYLVHRDRTGITEGLPAPPKTPPEQELPTPGEFETNQREFWFEATQVPVYLARDDLWPAQLREAEMRELLLTMLEWNTTVTSGAYTWYNGHHLDEWLPEKYRTRLGSTHARYEQADALRTLRELVDLYADVAAETGELLSLPVLDLRTAVHSRIDSVMGG